MYVSRRRSVRNAYLKQKILLYGLLGAIGFAIFGFVMAFFLFAWYAKDLPSPGKLAQVSGYSTVFYDRDGKVLFDMYKDKNRVPVAYKDISPYLKEATIAIEDKNFYKHKGFSETGMIRGFLQIFLKGRMEGGSTITQQLIKNVLLNSRRAMSRKIQELILALSVEKKYTKDQILEMYLNEAPYGGTYWGVGSAAKGYFNKEPKDLNLMESVILAGLPQNPSYYSPFIGQDDAWKGRAQNVLRRMREDKYITTAQEKKTLEEIKKYKFGSPNLSIEAPHFVFYIKDQVEKEYGSKIIDEGLKIKTTLSLPVQQAVEKIVKEEIGKLKDFNATNGAVVVLDAKTGDILAMVGSYDFNDEKFGKFNAALGLRQPGSTVKAITYATAFEKGYTASTVLMDVKTEFGYSTTEKPYTPVNYDGKFRGPMQVRFALGNSENIPAVKMIAMIGVSDFLQKASDMGLTQFAPTDENLKRFGLAITLGGGETTLLNLTSAFSVFAAGGIKRETSGINEIDDFKGKTFFKKGKVREKQVLTPEVAFIISHILSDNNARLEEFGPNSYLNIPGRTVAVKTGTSDDKRDNWAVGFTKDVVVGVWAGNNDNSPMNPKIASGATGASSIFYQIMRQILNPNFSKEIKIKDGLLDKPEKVKALTVDAYLGGLPKDGYPTRSEYYVEGTEPKDISSFYKKLKISKTNGKLANDVELKTGNFEEKDFIVFSENDPVSVDGKNRWQEAIDAWAREQTDGKYHPPTETSDNNSESVIVSIKSPSHQSTVGSGDLNIRVKIASIYKLKSVKIKLNGEEIRSWSEDKHDIDETISMTKDGVYDLQVIAVNEKDKSADSTVRFGVNKPWDAVTPTPTVTPKP